MFLEKHDLWHSTPSAMNCPLVVGLVFLFFYLDVILLEICLSHSFPFSCHSFLFLSNQIFLLLFTQFFPNIEKHNLASVVVRLKNSCLTLVIKAHQSWLQLFLVLALEPQHSALFASAHLAPKNELIGSFNRLSLFLLEEFPSVWNA